MIIYSHNKMYARPAWAKLPSEKREGQDEEEAFDEDNLPDEDRVDLLKSTYGILELQSRRNLLDPDMLAVKRQKNANIQAQSKVRIKGKGVLQQKTNCRIVIETYQYPGFPSQCTSNDGWW